MNSQNESLDELVHLEDKKSLKNMFKIGPIFILPNLAMRDKGPRAKNSGPRMTKG